MILDSKLGVFRHITLVLLTAKVHAATRQPEDNECHKNDGYQEDFDNDHVATILTRIVAGIGLTTR